MFEIGTLLSQEGSMGTASKVMKLAALHVEMLHVYCRDAELFASNAAAGLL